MSDLISILRERAIFTGDKFHGRVADEIERLTAELNNETEAHKMTLNREDVLQARVEALEAENKELDGLNYIQAGMLAEAGLAATEQETE